MLVFTIVSAFKGNGINGNKLSIKAQIGNWQKGDKFNLLRATISLTNNTDDTIAYRSMSCSSDDFYETNINVLTVQVQSCLSDYQILEKIPPHTTQQKKLNLQTDLLISRMYGIKFRLGFYFIQEHDSFNKSDFITHPDYYSQYLIYSDDIEITYKSHVE
jgi:hypothetical protein